MKRLGAILSALVAVTTIVGAAAVGFMLVHITAEVITRNLFRVSIPGTPAIVANYYMAAVSFLPVALAEKLDQHIAMDVVYRMLPNSTQVWVLRLVQLILAALTGAAASGFLLSALEKFGSGSFVLENSVKVPDWPGYFMLPIGFGLWSLICIYKLVASFRSDHAVLLARLRATV